MDPAKKTEVSLMNIQLPKPGRPDLLQTEYRCKKWGSEHTLTRMGRFKVRHLVIVSGQSMDMESHFHHAEHWIVVSGSAEVTVDGEKRPLFENQALHIPAGCRHRLENQGCVDLHMIEIQTGSYLEEDDRVVYA